MALHAAIGPQILISFTKTLRSLSRYGDDVVIQAKPDALSLSITNSSKTAYASVKLASSYFDRYSLKSSAQPGATFQTPPETDGVTGQLLVKSLLSILKHKTVERAVHRCELFILEGGQRLPDQDLNDIPEEESLSSRLILRLHCKQGVVKTHRLLLFIQSTSLVAPKIPNVLSSYLIVGPNTLHDILDHFPQSRGDPQLAWHFAENNVTLRSIETVRARARGSSQLSTEISLSADEFDSYSIEGAPFSISFHLREFNAIIILAESLSVALKMNFSLPGEPLIITFDTDTADVEYLFIISTIRNTAGGRSNPLKRPHEERNNGEMSAAAKRHANDSAATTLVSQAVSLPRSNPPERGEATGEIPSEPSEPPHNPEVPLFLPGATQDGTPPPPASQLPAADLELIRSAGLGIEHMDYEEFEAMMEAEGEEVEMSTAAQGFLGVREAAENNAEDNDEYMDMPMGASQVPIGRHGDREFRPLFDD